ncbi:hypothetical protein QYE76_000269 [Lolium multiflorum]|uniref:Protein kinase domain-containing protein n=1 Tax=Lolium multiflorum TaxID=4521 RepID=A0AAD8VXI3_LOLMU|nr:hypothetical protein QYE76_000269 [Lolium multiflorum]
MKVNATGIYLLADNAIDTVFTLLFADPLPSKLLKVHSSGRLRALSMAYSPTAARATLPAVWAAPASDCDLPLPCGSLGLCTPGNNGSSCMCPDAFSTHTTGGCAPANGAAPRPSQYRHCWLGAHRDGVGYFGSKFAVPVTAGDAFPACQDLCSANCSCLGFLYKNSSKSCFLLHDQIGSVLRARTDGTVGFIKTLPPLRSSRRHGSSSALSSITIVFGIVLPTVAAVFITFLLYVLAVHWLKNRRSPDGGKKKNKKHGGGGNGHGSSWFMLKMMSSRSSSRASSNAPSEMGDDDNEDHDDDEVLIPGLPARFTFADLEAATSGFRSQIGSGGFGSVYRGELPDRTTVAVKRMNNLGTQGRREFLTEIAVIGNVHHVNLVKLRGFCADHSRQLMLVYEFMSRGSLDQSLFLSRSGNKKTQALLEWPERVGPENILLDERGGVKIADFGLAKLLSPEQSGLFTTMRGTRGYLAPEWLTNAPVSDKADVYSFGMVLLEIVRGAKNSKLLQDDDNTAASSSAVSSSASSEGHGSSGSYFPAVALEAHEEGGRRYAELVDARLEGRAIAAEVARVVRVALCCLHEDASLRPAMTAVAAMLDGSMEVCEPRTEQLAYLRMYGRTVWLSAAAASGRAPISPPAAPAAAGRRRPFYFRFLVDRFDSPPLQLQLLKAQQQQQPPASAAPSSATSPSPSACRQLSTTAANFFPWKPYFGLLFRNHALHPIGLGEDLSNAASNLRSLAAAPGQAWPTAAPRGARLKHLPRLGRLTISSQASPWRFGSCPARPAPAPRVAAGACGRSPGRPDRLRHGQPATDPSHRPTAQTPQQSDSPQTSRRPASPVSRNGITSPCVHVVRAPDALLLRPVISFLPWTRSQVVDRLAAPTPCPCRARPLPGIMGPRPATHRAFYAAQPARPTPPSARLRWSPHTAALRAPHCAYGGGAAASSWTRRPTAHIAAAR